MDVRKAELGELKDYGMADVPCAFSSPTAASLGTTDPVQLAAGSPWEAIAA